ncbi:hypothetical protein P3G55_01835 [Leptospira sp. 96542]|nr:hypothetical protein [Leptospira sp. 96542]
MIPHLFLKENRYDQLTVNTFSIMGVIRKKRTEFRFYVKPTPIANNLENIATIGSFLQKNFL